MTFSLTILGSSSALPTSDRTVTAHVLNVHERFFLIDCGEGTQLQLRKYRIRFGRIYNIFISHLHGDHFYGLFGLLSSLNLMGRKVPINIYGPPGLKKYLDLHFSDSSVQLDYALIFNPLDMNNRSIILDDKDLRVESFPLNHKIDAAGFLFTEKERERNIRKNALDGLKPGLKDIIALKQGRDFIDDEGRVYMNAELTSSPPLPRSYAFCSDTRYYEPIIPVIKGVDLLYHEATYLHEMKARAVKTGHSTAREAAMIAAAAGAGKLIIGHFSNRYKNIDPLREEARAVFPETYAAEDGLCIKVEQRLHDNND